MQILAPALRILGRDPIISHFSGNFMNKQKSSLENLLFVLDLQKTSVQWRRMIVKKPLKNFNALVDSLHYRMKAKTSKGPPDIGDFPKRIGAWIRAFSAEALRLFSTPISSAIFIPSQLQILQKCCSAPRWFMQCTCFTPRPLLLLCSENATIFLPFLVTQRRDHLLDDDSFLSSGFWEYFLLFWRFFHNFYFFFRVLVIMMLSCIISTSKGCVISSPKNWLTDIRPRLLKQPQPRQPLTTKLM